MAAEWFRNAIFKAVENLAILHQISRRNMCVCRRWFKWWLSWFVEQDSAVSFVWTGFTRFNGFLLNHICLVNHIQFLRVFPFRCKFHTFWLRDFSPTASSSLRAFPSGLHKATSHSLLLSNRNLTIWAINFYLPSLLNIHKLINKLNL